MFKLHEVLSLEHYEEPQENPILHIQFPFQLFVFYTFNASLQGKTL